MITHCVVEIYLCQAAPLGTKMNNNHHAKVGPLNSREFKKREIGARRAGKNYTLRMIKT